MRQRYYESAQTLFSLSDLQYHVRVKNEATGVEEELSMPDILATLLLMSQCGSLDLEGVKYAADGHMIDRCPLVDITKFSEWCQEGDDITVCIEIRLTQARLDLWDKQKYLARRRQRATSDDHKKVFLDALSECWMKSGWNSQRFGQLIANASYRLHGDLQYQFQCEDLELMRQLLKTCDVDETAYIQRWNEIKEES